MKDFFIFCAVKDLKKQDLKNEMKKQQANTMVGK